MALTIWGIGKAWGYRTKESFYKAAAAAAILPIITVSIFGMIRMQINPKAANEISAQTINQIVGIFANDLPYIVLADFAGGVAGSIINMFGSRR